MSFSNISAIDHFGTEHWRSICDVTLTLKQSFQLPDTKTRVYIDEFQCRDAFRHFMKMLNRAVFGNAARRNGKRLRVISVLEKDAHARWHYHAAIEPPPHVDEAEFLRMIRKCWRKVDWGYEQTCVRSGADAGWIRYMLKPRQKSGFETWSDCIDWFSFHNPIADA